MKIEILVKNSMSNLLNRYFGSQIYQEVIVTDRPFANCFLSSSKNVTSFAAEYAPNAIAEIQEKLLIQKIKCTEDFFCQLY